MHHVHAHVHAHVHVCTCSCTHVHVHLHLHVHVHVHAHSCECALPRRTPPYRTLPWRRTWHPSVGSRPSSGRRRATRYIATVHMCICNAHARVPAGCGAVSPLQPPSCVPPLCPPCTSPIAARTSPESSRREAGEATRRLACRVRAAVQVAAGDELGGARDRPCRAAVPRARGHVTHGGPTLPTVGSPDGCTQADSLGVVWGRLRSSAPHEPEAPAEAVSRAPVGSLPLDSGGQCAHCVYSRLQKGLTPACSRVEYGLYVNSHSESSLRPSLLAAVTDRDSLESHSNRPLADESRTSTSTG